MITLEQLQNQKLGSIPYRRGSQWDVSTDDPSALAIPYWKANNTLGWTLSPSFTNLSVSGWERVGSLVVPTNQTAGDFTANRIFVPDQTLGFPTQNGLINGYTNTTATSPFVARMDSSTTDPAFFAQGAAVVPVFAGVRSAGTIASPSAVLLNNNLVRLDAWGFYDATHVSKQGGLVFIAAENWSSSAMGVTAGLNLTAAGGTAVVTNHVWTPAAYTVTGYVDASVGFRQGTMTAGRVLRSDGTNFVAAQLAFSDLAVPATVNATTGYQVNGAAASGNVLRGNGTNFVSSAIQSGDLATAFAAGTAYTPTVTAAIGTITTSSASGRWLQVGKWLYLSVSITITTNGTGAGNLNFTLPNSLNVAATQVLPGRNIATGIMLQAYATAGNTMSSNKYDNTYPAADGSVLAFSGVLEVA